MPCQVADNLTASNLLRVFYMGIRPVAFINRLMQATLSRKSTLYLIPGVDLLYGQ